MGQRMIPRPDGRLTFNYWIELRDISNGSVREIPLEAIRRVHIPTRKQVERQPDQEILRLKDGAILIEAESLDELKRRLRAVYPDARFERTLRCQRDEAAEANRAAAMDELVKLLARAAVDQYLREQSGPEPVCNTPICE